MHTLKTKTLLNVEILTKVIDQFLRGMIHDFPSSKMSNFKFISIQHRREHLAYPFNCAVQIPDRAKWDFGSEFWRLSFW